MYLHILHMHIVEFKSMAYDTNIKKYICIQNDVCKSYNHKYPFIAQTFSPVGSSGA